MKIHSYISASRVNGPGTRFVLWTQGCSIRCPGCFNPATHDPDAGEDKSVYEILSLFGAVCEEAEGITVSGGEPFDQPDDLYVLLHGFNVSHPKKNVVVFTGYEKKDIELKGRSAAMSLNEIDMLISGPYVESLKVHDDGLIASSNQKIILLNEMFAGRLIEGGIECIIDEKTGDMTCTGFPFGELLQDAI